MIPDRDVEDARPVASILGIETRVIEISRVLGCYRAALPQMRLRPCGWKPEGEGVLGICYDDANAILRGIVAGRSEDDLAAEFGAERLDLIKSKVAGGRHKREFPPTPANE